MSESAKKFLFGVLLILAGGGLIGWFYDQLERGLLIAALLILAWQVRNLLAFERALRTQDFGVFRYGDGIWQQIFSRFSFEHERALRRKRRHRTLLKEIRKSTDAMPDGAVILNSDNEIVICNRAAKILAGLKPKKDRGQRVDNLLRTPALTKLLSSDDPTASVEIPSPKQDDIWLNCRVVPYGAEEKLLFIRDVTESRRLNKMRRDFVANASHELRSPLTVISGYLDSIADDSRLAADWVQPIKHMRDQANRMTRILTELLELSRLESAGDAGYNDSIDVGSLLNATKNSCTELGQNINVESISEARLLGDRGEIESLLNNLVSNACRHTDTGGAITVSWSTGTKGGELVVEDTGEGIAPEHLPRLTERFFRVDRGRSRDDGGVGLGLAIVKHVLSRHGGRLSVESEPGVGSTFRCHFPPTRIAGIVSQN